MYHIISKYKQAVLEQQMRNSKRLPPYQGTKIPRLFPTLMRMMQKHYRHARIARIGRLKKRGRSRWI